MLQSILAGPPSALLSDPRFYGIERIDLKAQYGARCDGASHLMTQAAALAAYPNCGATDTIELDTAAWLEAEYDLRTRSGGIIGLADGASLFASRTLWLQDAGRVHFHGGRGTKVFGEGCGSAPVLRVSNASSNSAGNATGSAQPVPLRDLTLFAQNSGRSGSYRPGSCAIQIDDGGPAGASSGLSGPASVYATIEAVRWFNFDDSTRWGDNTFSITLRHCMAENNNEGLSWRQTTGLNSMERMVIEGGSFSNNRYGLRILCTWTDGTGAHPQGGSWFIKGASIDYNSVSQGVFLLADPGNGYPQNSLHMSNCHIENNAATLGAAAPWFTFQGRAGWTDNEWYINGSAPSTGLVSIGDNSSGAMVGNRIGGSAPLFFSSTSNYKDVSGYGNICNPVGAPVILLSDAAGVVLQSRGPSDARKIGWYQGDFTLSAAVHGNLDFIDLQTGCTNFVLPASALMAPRVGFLTTVRNTSTSAITIQVPPGFICAGAYGYADNRSTATGGANNTSTSIPANTEATLERVNANSWVFTGGVTIRPS